MSMFGGKSLFCLVVAAAVLSGCTERPAEHRLGISFGVGQAQRWPYEIQAMTAHARALGLQVDARLNKDETAKTQLSDCEEMIDQGASALIIVPRDAGSMTGCLRKARARNVKVIVYARAILDGRYDFFVGYDTYRIGWSMGNALAERLGNGDVAILQGDPHDINTPSLQDGALRAIEPYVADGNVRVVFNAPVPGWSPETAKALLKQAIQANGGRIDGVLAHNDILAGAAAEVIRELGLRNRVVVVGMDAELPALRRLARGKQDVTIRMDLKSMAMAAVDAAHSLIKDRPTAVNAEVRTPSGSRVDAYLVNGKVVTKENLDRLIIEPGIFRREDVYATSPAP